MGQTRGSVLWGNGNGNGSGGRARGAALAALTIALCLPAASLAAKEETPSTPSGAPNALVQTAKSNPDELFSVIVLSKANGSAGVAAEAAKRGIAAAPPSNTAIEKARKAAEHAQRKAAERSQELGEAEAEAARLPGDRGKEKALAKARRDTEKARGEEQEARQRVNALIAGRSRPEAQITDTFQSVPAVAVQLTGSQLLEVARNGNTAVVPDSAVAVTGIDNRQKWYRTIEADWYRSSDEMEDNESKMPAIAIVDSGVDRNAAYLGSRLLTQVDLTSVGPNSPGDGWGHGTMVASLAAARHDRYAGANPAAKVVSLDVVNDNGEARTSDVIRAADWILKNKDAYKIRVANFSLQSAAPSTFLLDPLDKAVERLWRTGIVVVAAAGNYGVNGQATQVQYAPANDPFIISVGALDVRGTDYPQNDVAAPWSAYGYTLDGFRKPELSAPGRFMIGGIPKKCGLGGKGGQNPSLVDDGLLKMSGTSFSAPLVSGAAAGLLAEYPQLTPDQVKGILMASASSLPSIGNWAGGVGELDMEEAFDVVDDALDEGDPLPNPNLALNKFLVPDPAGGPLPVFDADKWVAAANGTASWASASWATASWASASWATASWATASWATASWATGSFTSASWATASWANASWTSAAVPNYADGDPDGDG